MRGCDVAILIPYIDSGCPWRAKARDYTQGLWSRFEVEIVYGSHDGSPVNRSAARNDAARQTKADVLVFADADTWIEHEQFLAMVGHALDGKLVHGYTQHVKLAKQNTEAIYQGRMSLAGQVINDQPCGVIAVTRDLFECVGGFDERFQGWGGEDRAFQYACDVLAGPGTRVPGFSYHLWHPRSPEQGRVPPIRRDSMALALRYKRAAGMKRRAGVLPATKDAAPNVEAMLALLSEESGPLHMSPGRVRNRSTQIA